MGKQKENDTTTDDIQTQRSFITPSIPYQKWLSKFTTKIYTLNYKHAYRFESEINLKTKNYDICLRSDKDDVLLGSITFKVDKHADDMDIVTGPYQDH